MKISHTRSSAFSLVEITLAIGVFSVCLLAIAGLLPVGAKTTRLSEDQTAASAIQSALAADLFSTPRTSNASTHYGLPLPAAGARSNTSIFLDELGEWDKTSQTLPPTSTQPVSRYAVRISLVGPPTATPRMATRGTILIWWPAGAAAANSAGAYTSYLALDRN